jgi:hypothetical protein
MKTLSFLIGTAIILDSTLGLRAQGCCAGSAAMPAGCSMGGAAAGHEGHGGTTASAPAQTALPKLALSGAAKPVFENYLAAQASLASDSMGKNFHQRLSARPGRAGRRSQDVPDRSGYAS